MSRQIMNGGIEGGILRAAKDSGAKLSEKDEKRLEMLESIPNNEWIDLDDNGEPISKQEAAKNFRKHLSKFKVIN